MSAGPRTDTLQTFFDVSDVILDPELPFVDRLERALSAGSEHLDLSAGFLTNIDQAADRQEILVLNGTAGNLREDVSVPLGESYCRKTMASESGTMTVADATAEGWTDDPAYQRFDLESYVGSVLAFDGDRRGTVCFAGDDPAPDTFDGTAVALVELLARWASYELSLRAGRGLVSGNGVVASFADRFDRDTVDTTLELLSNELRRDLLAHLARSDGPVAIPEVAESLATDGDHPARAAERVEVALIHRHIPILRDANVVTYDERTKELTYQPTDTLGRFLGQTDLLER